MRKKNLAIIGVGIIGAGALDQGIPAMVNGIIKLQEKYSITIYSFIPVDKTKAPKGIRIRCIWSGRMLLKIQYAYLVCVFIKDHLIKRYTLIHAQSPYPAGELSLWLNRFFKVPWVLSLHAGETACMPEIPFGDLLTPRLKKAAFAVCSKADLLMTMSQFQADITRQNLKLERDIVVLHRGVKVEPYYSKSLIFPINFLHISNYNLIKDYFTLLNAFALIKAKIPCYLTIVGNNYGEELKHLIISLGLEKNVVVKGVVPNSELKELFISTHIVLHTSRFEGLPMVALEAMANGTVVCGTHVGIMADFSGKCCLTTAPGDYTQLADIVVKIVKDEFRYEQLREQAYQWVKDRDLQWYVTELDKLYSKII